MFFKQITAAYAENQTNHVNTKCRIVKADGRTAVCCNASFIVQPSQGEINNTSAESAPLAISLPEKHKKSNRLYQDHEEKTDRQPYT
jgi:hypothetical protein